MAQRGAPLIFLAVFLLGSAPAAKPITVAVLPIAITEDGVRSPFAFLLEVQAASELRPSLEIMAEQELFSLGAQGLADPLVQCGSDVACLVGKLKPFNAPWALIVLVNELSAPPILSLRVVDVPGSKIVATMTEALSVGSQSSQLATTIREAVTRIFEDLGHPRAAHLTVEVDPPRASVSVIAAHDRHTNASNQFTLPPGEYEVIADLEGHASSRRRIALVGGQREIVSLRLDEASSLVESPWLWIVSGALVVGAAVAAGVLLGSRDSCYCLTTGQPCPDSC